MALLNVPNGTVSYSKASEFRHARGQCGNAATRNGVGLTDPGADYRLKDGATYASADFYLTNLFNHFITDTIRALTRCANSPTPCPSGVAPGIPIYYSSNINLSNSRFEGIEAQLRRLPREGVGYNLSGALSRGYAYNIARSIYCAFHGTAATPRIRSTNHANLGIVSGNNFTGGALSTFGKILNGFSNQSIPYLQANGEVNYTATNGAYAAFGDTVYGKEQLAQPPAVLDRVRDRPVSVSAPTLSLQVSGDNIFNAYPGVLPVEGGRGHDSARERPTGRNERQRARAGHLHVRPYQDVRWRGAQQQPV